MSIRLVIALISVLAAPLALAQSEEKRRGPSKLEPGMVLGPRNMPLYDGAQALLEGDFEEGVQLTLQGLKIAHGRREEEAALSNLCAGYIKLGKYEDALTYCDILIARNDKNWRGYNNRAVVHILTKQYDKAVKDLELGEELNPGARTLKVARAMYMDAVYPVNEEVEIDDRKDGGENETQR